MFYAIIILYTMLVVPYTTSYIKRFGTTPVSVWLCVEILFFYGIAFSPKGATDLALRLEALYLIANASYILGVELCDAQGVLKNSDNCGGYADYDPSKNQLMVIWLIIIVSIAACSYLFISSGLNVFVQSLKDFFSDQTNNYSKERAGYYGVRGQGYIYQFRVVLLPLLSTYLLMGINKKYPRGIVLPLFFLMLVFILGTGQRTAFVYYCIIVILYYIDVRRVFHITLINRFERVLLGGLALFFLIVLTISNGRVEGDGNALFGAFESLINRVMFVNQKTAITAFSYIVTQPIVWGYDWLMMMMDILPGQSGYLSVDRIVYHLAYGTYNGTGPPCIWGSAWYNFGYFGVTLFPVIMGFAYHSAYRKMYRTKDKNKLYLLIYIALCVYMGLWTYGTPMTLFNNGVVAVLLLRWLIFVFMP